MPVPQNTAGIRRFLGMVTFVAKFLPHFADSIKPLRDLLVKDNDWTWSHMQQTAFDKLKNELASPTVLAQYRPQAKGVSGRLVFWPWGSLNAERGKYAVASSCLHFPKPL